MRDWILSHGGDKWTVKLDVWDHGGHLDTTFRGWSATLASGVRLAISRLVLSSVLPLDFHGRQGLTTLLRRGRCSGRVHLHGSRISLFTPATVTFSPATSKTVELVRKCLLRYGASGESFCFCLRDGGFLAIFACSHSDASLHGWALAYSFWPRETFAQVGRTLERHRFRRIGPHSARESALPCWK